MPLSRNEMPIPSQGHFYFVSFLVFDNYIHDFSSDLIGIRGMDDG
jgi:hypothetical protein